MTGVQTCALRSEEHTSELQSHDNLVCRLLLEKKTCQSLLSWPPCSSLVSIVMRRPSSLFCAAPVHATPCRRATALAPVRSPASFFFFRSRTPPESTPLPHRPPVVT